ncbi:MAG: hypothetical protein SW833_05745 [Cyanobacteriota bacterium]|nr:hypothetical protein [Cyanobacteriota bacterium]
MNNGISLKEEDLDRGKSAIAPTVIYDNNFCMGQSLSQSRLRISANQGSAL